MNSMFFDYKVRLLCFLSQTRTMLWVFIPILLSTTLSCATRPILVGVVLELSGEASNYGMSIRNAIELAIENVNNQGGIQGKPVKVLYRDAASSPDIAVQVTRELVEKEKVKYIIGAATSTVTLAIGRYCQDHHVILITPAASSPQITYIGDFVFRNFPSDRLESQMMAITLREKFNIDEVITFHIDNDYGRDLFSLFSNEFRKMNGSIKADFTYAPGTRDFTPWIEKIPNLNETPIYAIGYSQDLMALIRQLRSKDQPPWIFTVSAIAVPEVLEQGGKSLEHIIFLQPVYEPESSSDPIVKRFVTLFRKRFGTTPDIYAAHGYDAMIILAHTMRLFGTRVEDIQLGLTQLHGFKGVAGLTTFNEDGDVLRFPRLYTIENGHFVQLDNGRLKALFEMKKFH